MLRYRSLNRKPPKGFQYRDRDTGTMFERNVFAYLVQDVANHREGNNLPPVSEADIQHQGCSKLEGSTLREFCESDDPNDVTVNGVTLHASDIARGTLTIGTFKLLGESLVPIEEANRRAAICALCPFNVAFRLPCGDGICGELLAAVEGIVGASATSSDAKLHACAVCKCHLKAKVFLPINAIQRYESDELKAKYPEACWLATPTAT